MSHEFLRHTAASVLALLLDCLVMAGLIHALTWAALPASACGFLAGMVLAYVLSVGWVYRGHQHRVGWRGWCAFSVIGLAALAINSSLVWLGTSALGMAWPMAKAIAAAGSFSFNHLARRATLFRPNISNSRGTL